MDFHNSDWLSRHPSCTLGLGISFPNWCLKKFGQYALCAKIIFLFSYAVYTYINGFMWFPLTFKVQCKGLHLLYLGLQGFPVTRT